MTADLLDQFRVLAVYGFGSADAEPVRVAARAGGLAVLDLPQDPTAITTAPGPGLAWRCPPGLAVLMRRRGTPLPVTAPSARWFAELPRELTGRRLQACTVRALLARQLDLPSIGMVKLADLKSRQFDATRVHDLHQAQRARACPPMPDCCSRTAG